MPLVDKFNKVSNGSQALPTTLSADKSAGAATASLNAATGWDITTAKHIRMFKTKVVNGQTVPDTTQLCYYKATLAGTTLSSITLVYSSTGVDQKFVIGDTVDQSPTTRWADDLVDGILTSLNQDGTVKAGAVSAATMVADGILTAAKSTTATNIETRGLETIFDHVASGGVWTADSVGVNLNASMTALVVYINGQRGTVSAVTARAFTPNLDTYIDVLNTAGVFTLVYPPAATNAASPALAANSIRIGIIQAAATITATTKVNQGQEDRVFPIASSIPYAVTDSLGNLICNRDPQQKLLGFRRITSSFTTTAVSTDTDVTGLSVQFIADGLRKVRIISKTYAMVSSGAAGFVQQHTIKESSTELASSSYTSPGSNYSEQPSPENVLTPTAGLHTYKTSVNQGAAGTLTFSASSTSPAFIRVERY